MNIKSFVADLVNQDIQLWVDGDQLRYRAPKGVLTPVALQTIGANKAEILQFLKDQQDVESDPLSSMQIIPDPDQMYQPFPLTEIQLAFWMGRGAAFDLSNVGNHGYIEVEAVKLDLTRFHQAFQRLIERHVMLHSIVRSDGQQQIIEHVPSFHATIVDLRGKDQYTVIKELALIRQTMDHQVLSVETWQSFDLCIALLDGERCRLHLSVEFMFIDAWSIRLLIQEFINFYHEPDAYAPPLELTFRDYVLTEEKLQEMELYHRSEKYWMQRIPSLHPAPELPLARSLKSVSQPRFVPHQAHLSAEIWSRLKARAAKAGLTPSGVLLAAFAEVLTAWSKNPRFSINLSIFNRLPLHPEVNNIVGDFTSLLVLSIDNSIEATFETRAQRLQEQLWQDLDHNYYRGVHVLREMARAQGSSVMAVLPVVFTSTLAHNTLLSSTEEQYTAPWEEDLIYCVTQTPQVWLDHQVIEIKGELVFYWFAVDELFPEGLLEAMFSAYCQLLQRLATQEESWQEPIESVVPPSQLEQRALVNATQAPLSEQWLHTPFFKYAHEHPEHPAVITLQRTLSYRQIATAATLLASQLRTLGARPNQLVAVVMEKGWEQVVALHGIVSAGAAFLPLDPHLPQERLDYLLLHSEVQIVVTQSWVEPNITWPEHLQRIVVDTLDMQQSGVVPLAPVQQREDLAYVIYTSGSTGVPKGVMIDHRGAVNTIIDLIERFEIGSDDRVLALSSLSFDLSVFETFGFLGVGGTLVLPEERALRDPVAWVELLIKAQVTIWDTVPAFLQMLVEYCETQPEILSDACIRLAFLSGDWIPTTLPDRLKKLVPETAVVSLGGATEVSICSIYYPIHEIDPSWKSIPYGRPMRNQYFQVLNELLQPCPIWVPGYLYIGGVGLAIGYWHDEEKTKASFIYHPRTGERLYRTGDLGRYLPDGNIEFLGREDFQVKVRGYRIELGEIEETLAQHPDVHAAVASTIATSHEDKRLVAYVVLRSGLETNTIALDQQDVESNEPGNPSDELSDSTALRRLDVRYGQTSIRKDDKPVIALTRPTSERDLLEKYKERVSYRSFRAEQISFEHFSNFLTSLGQIELDGLPKYLYPSGGGIYPVQTYLYIRENGVEGVPEGLYYYNPRTHQLVVLSHDIHLNANVYDSINQPIFGASAFSLFFIGQLRSMSSVYGDLARDFSMLEAGYMSQLLMMSAPLNHIGLCPVGGVDFAAIQEFFLLEDSHQLLHSLLGGSIDPAVASGWSFLPESAGISSIQSAAQSPTEGIIGELHDLLKEKLPEYMVPSAIVILDEFPLAATGKVDRKHLPIPESLSQEMGITYVAPDSELEQTIADVWSEQLPAAKVGVCNTFFDLGGNSLLMVRAYTRLQKLLALDLSITEVFFQYPTIRQLAEFLAQSQQVLLKEEIAKG